MQYKINKQVLLFLIIGVITIIAIISSQSANPFTTERKIKKEKMTFIVHVPKNTPKEDIIYIYPYGDHEIKMKKLGRYTHKVNLHPKDIDFVTNENGESVVWYRYSRNGWDYITSEYLPGKPDTNDFFWTERGRKILFKGGKTQEDTVFRWRWFPEGRAIKEDSSDLKPQKFQSRINNIIFRSGQGIQDLHIDGFQDFYTTTAKHMKEIGYKWAVLFPAWQWTEEGTLPKLNNAVEINSNYSDEILLRQIREYRKVGIKIILAPQICCTEIKTEDRSKEWWKVYWKEVERFLVHYAKLAEEARAEALVADIAFIGISRNYTDEIKTIEQEGWSNAWKAVREIYSREIGQMVWNFGGGSGGLTPEADFITWADKLDFLYVQSEAELSPSSVPTDEELLEGINKELDIIQTLYDVHKKPVIVQSGLHSIKSSWHGFKDVDWKNTSCGESGPEEGCKGIYSQKDQARSVHAYFMGIKDRPWIIGYFNFGYDQYLMPLFPGWSIRGKAAEDVWQKWNNVIY